MKLTPVSIDAIRARGGYRKTKNQTLIEDFLSSGEVCVRFDDMNYSNVYCGYNSILSSIKNFHYEDIVGVATSKGELYMYRKDCFNDLETE